MCDFTVEIEKRTESSLHDVIEIAFIQAFSSSAMTTQVIQLCRICLGDRR